MRSRLLYILSAIVLIVTACKKDIREKSVRAQSETAVKIMSWLDGQKRTNADAYNKKVDELKVNLDLGNAYVERSGNRKLILARIDKGYEASDKQGRKSENVLILEINEREEIINASVVQVISEGANASQVALLPKLYNGQTDGLDGRFVFRKISGTFQYELDFKAGKLSAIKNMRKGNKGNAQTRTTQCIDWYLVTTIHYPDGSTYQTEEYVTTTCNGCSAEPYEQSECLDPDNGGGGDGAITETVEYVEEDLAPMLITTQGAVQTEPGSNTQTKQVSYNWGVKSFERRTAFGSVKWGYRSLETGNLERPDNNAAWKFTSLVHNDILLEGTTPGGLTVTHTLGQAIPSYGSAMATAQMSLVFNVSVLGDPASQGPGVHSIVTKTSPTFIAQ